MTPRLELKETALPSGAAVGSMLLNRTFDNYLKKILGEEQYEKLRKNKDNHHQWIMSEFDKKIKPKFNGPEEWDKKYKKISKISFGGIDIRDDPENNIMESSLRVNGKMLFDIFDPIMTEIENLIKSQLKSVKDKTGEPAKAIFLVGGFGASPYLKQRVEKLATDSINVLCPPNAWSAIVRGAVLSKIPNVISVTSSIAAKSYGIRANMVFYEHEHTQEDALHARMLDVMRIERMEWSIYKGDDLFRENTWTIELFRILPLDYTTDDLVFECELEECDATVPPVYPWKGTLNSSCKIKCDLRHIDRTKLEREGSHYILNYELCVQTGPALRSFSLIFDGQSYESTDIRLAYD